MRTLFRNILLLAFIMLVLPGCMVKKNMKKAAAYEAAGMFREASELYYTTCLKRPGKPEIKIALKRSGQLWLDELSDNITQSYSRGEYKTTVYEYLKASDFIAKLGNAGVDLKQDPSVKRNFDDAREIYLARRYEAGQKSMGEKNYDEAKSTFTEIFNIDPDFRNTRNYLKESTFEPVYQDGARLFGEGKYMEAYTKWNSLFIQDNNFRDVADQMQQALGERYKQGSLLLMDEKFQDAAIALGEVYRADPAFRDVNALFTEARNEPVYRSANVFLQGGKCRSAYFAFDNVVKDAGTYKDAASQRDKALDCAQYPIAVKTTLHGTKTPDSQQFQTQLINQLINQKNLFLKIYDLSVVDRQIEKSLITRSGNFDATVLQQLGTKQIKAVLYLDFTEIARFESPVKKNDKTGFERWITKNAAGENVVNVRQVKYTETSAENSVSMSVTYKLVSVESGQVLLSDRLADSRKETMKFATYSGSGENLYPATSRNGVSVIDEPNYRGIQALLHAPRTISSAGMLTDNMFASFSRKIAAQVNNFNPEK